MILSKKLPSLITEILILLLGIALAWLLILALIAASARFYASWIEIRTTLPQGIVYHYGEGGPSGNQIEFLVDAENGNLKEVWSLTGGVIREKDCTSEEWASFVKDWKTARTLIKK